MLKESINGRIGKTLKTTAYTLAENTPREFDPYLESSQSTLSFIDNYIIIDGYFCTLNQFFLVR